MTHTGCLLATSDNEIGKTGPVPLGCGENRVILHSRPQQWTRDSPRARLRLTRFSHATPSALVVLTGPNANQSYRIPKRDCRVEAAIK